MKKHIINFWKSELEKPRCYYCNTPKVISDWVEGRDWCSNGERFWYKTYGCPSPKCSFRTKESLITACTSSKTKADKMLNRKLYGYKLNLTNMGIIKNTIKIIVVLVAIFIIVNVFWWLFGGMISKIHFSPLVITNTKTITKEAPNCLLQSINTGDVITYQGEQWNVIGTRKDVYDYSGDTINIDLQEKNPRHN